MTETITALPPPLPKKRSRRPNQSEQECLREALDCWAACVDTLRYCLGKGGPLAGEKILLPLLDCAEVCRTTSDLIRLRSKQQRAACGICAKICAECAESCEAVADPRLVAAAEACRRAAGLCEAIAQR